MLNKKLNRKKNSVKLKKKILSVKKKIKQKPKAKKVLVIKKKIVKKVKTGGKKRIVPKEIDVQFPAQALFKAKIKVIGIGGGGGSIVSEIGRSLEKATFVVADTDMRAMKKKPGIKYLCFGQEFTRGLGTGANVELAKQAAESIRDKMKDIFQDQDIVIFIASLGGGLGSGATQIFAEEAKKFGGITLGIFTTPFKFEGNNKHRISQNSLKVLKEALNVSLVIPNEKIFKIIDETTPITTAFSTVNKSLIDSLESLIDLIYNPGIINIDFADLRTILKGRGNLAFLNTIHESGKDRVEKTCQNVFKNVLLQNNGFKAGKILFNISGDEKLSMFEVEKISSHISSLNPQAKIIFGISKDNKLRNKIKTTILMTDGQANSEKELSMQEKPKLDVKLEAKPKAEVVKIIKNKKIIKKVKKTKPVLELPTQVQSMPTITEIEKIDIKKSPSELPAKKTIRRSGLEIKKAEEIQEKKRQEQEEKWEIPAFLRFKKEG
jgi:cell division protein FtsZ